MGGMNIDADLIIDKSIHKSTNSRSSVLKVYKFFFSTMHAVIVQKFHFKSKEVASLEDVVKIDSSIEQRVYFVRGFQRKESRLD